MDEHHSMTTVRALAILDIKSSKFHSVKDGYNGLNKVRKWVIHKKILYQNSNKKNYVPLYTDRFYDCTIYILDIILWPFVIHFWNAHFPRIC